MIFHISQSTLCEIFDFLTVIKRISDLRNRH